MNLRWNGSLRRFEAEFADFQGDLAAVKAAGFRCDGPPGWVWYSNKAEPLSKLRENRPASGLTISPDAREQYTALWAVEENNLKVKAALAETKKELKKKLKKDEQAKNATPGKMCELGFVCVSKEDLPPLPPFLKQYTPPPPPDLKCVICGVPVYFYEKQSPPTCLWCEKKVLDIAEEVC